MRDFVWWVLVITYALNIPATVWMIGRHRDPYTPNSAIASMCVTMLFIAGLLVIRP